MIDLTATGLFNLVIDPIAEESILSSSDDRGIARWLNRNYPIYRDALLQQHPWKFAMKRASVAEDATIPEFEWLHRYRLPSDCIRLMPVTTDGYQNSPVVKHIVEGKFVLTNLSAPLRIRYISRMDNPADWTPLFAQVLAHSLRTGCAFYITGKQQVAKMVSDSFPATLANAQRLDGLEGVPDEPDDSDVILVR